MYETKLWFIRKGKPTTYVRYFSFSFISLFISDNNGSLEEKKCIHFIIIYYHFMPMVGHLILIDRHSVILALKVIKLNGFQSRDVFLAPGPT